MHTQRGKWSSFDYDNLPCKVGACKCRRTEQSVSSFRIYVVCGGHFHDNWQNSWMLPKTQTITGTRKTPTGTKWWFVPLTHMWFAQTGITSSSLAGKTSSLSIAQRPQNMRNTAWIKMRSQKFTSVVSAVYIWKIAAANSTNTDVCIYKIEISSCVNFLRISRKRLIQKIFWSHTLLSTALQRWYTIDSFHSRGVPQIQLYQE